MYFAVLSPATSRLRAFPVNPPREPKFLRAFSRPFQCNSLTCPPLVGESRSRDARPFIGLDGFGVRFSDLGFPSGFGIRFSDFPLCRASLLTLPRGGRSPREPKLHHEFTESLRSLHCNSGSCSQAATNLREKDKPRITRNTQKANREEARFPRIPRIPRFILPAFGCGSAALCSLWSKTSLCSFLPAKLCSHLFRVICVFRGSLSRPENKTATGEPVAARRPKQTL